MSCTVCNHPQLPDIELALLAGDTLKSLHQCYGLSPSSLQRHKKHLESKLRSVRYRLDHRQDQGCLLRLNDILNYVQQGLETAAANGEIDRVFRGAAISSRIINQIHQMEVKWDLDTVYRLTHSQGSASLDSLLPAGPGALSELNRAFLNKASAPCPEPEGEEDQDAAAAAKPGDSCETQSSRLEALNLLQDLLPDLNLSLNDIPELPDSQTVKALPHQNTASCLSPGVKLSLDDISLPAGSAAANGRKISEKLPAKTAPPTANIEEIQEDNLGEKNLPANAAAEAENNAPPADEETSFPLLQAEKGKRETENDLLTDPWPLTTEHCPVDSLETQNSELETGFPTDPRPLATNHYSVDSLETLYSELETAFPETRNQEPETAFEESAYCPLPTANCLLPSANCLCDETAPPAKPAPDHTQAEPAPAEPDLALLLSNSADDLFEITHGYKRNNPPKHIPNRRRDEDFRSFSIFGDPSKILG